MEVINKILGTVINSGDFKNSNICQVMVEVKINDYDVIPYHKGQLLDGVVLVLLNKYLKKPIDSVLKSYCINIFKIHSIKCVNSEEIGYLTHVFSFSGDNENLFFNFHGANGTYNLRLDFELNIDSLYQYKLSEIKNIINKAIILENSCIDFNNSVTKTVGAFLK